MRTIIDPISSKQQIIAIQVVDYLTRARVLLGDGGLGKDNQPKNGPSVPAVIEASAYLNNADRFIIWLYPGTCLGPESEKVLARLERLRPAGWKRLRNEIMNCAECLSSANAADLERPKAVLDQAVAAINETVVENHISTKLQIKCLGHLIVWGLCLTVALFLASTVAVNPQDSTNWMITGSEQEWFKYFVRFVSTVVIGLCGSLGGFLSGLMDARRVKMTIESYQERMRLLAIKPVVGALVAVILFFLLSWKVVPAVSPANAGAYLMVAFLAGFSEKYFLRLLPLYAKDAKARSAHDLGAHADFPENIETTGNDDEGDGLQKKGRPCSPAEARTGLRLRELSRPTRSRFYFLPLDCASRLASFQPRRASRLASRNLRSACFAAWHVSCAIL
jgi:hypothetical protein